MNILNGALDILYGYSLGKIIPTCASRPRDRHGNCKTAKLDFHCDSTSSNVYSQTNWWAPIYQAIAGSTIAYYLEYWGKPL